MLNSHAPILEVRDLKKDFDATEVIKGISFSLEQNEVLSIIGSSGSGKTTLLRCLNFLETPSEGQISVKGELLFDAADPATQREADIRKKRLHFGLVFQSFNLLAPLTALENVMLPCYFGPSGESRANRLERARGALARVGLADKAKQRPPELSGGERQRVAIARALFGKPRLILCDEPTGNLDAKTGAEVIGLFVDLVREQKLTMVVVTHEDRVSQAARRVLRLRDGRLVEGLAEMGAAS